MVKKESTLPDWKINQYIHRVSAKPSRDAITADSLVVVRAFNLQDAYSYITEQREELVYPMKSFMVAVIYATMLEKYFKEDFYKVLNDKDLLPGDPFFKPYSKEKEKYDALIEFLKGFPDWLNGGWVPTTVEYFKEECLNH